MEHLLLNPGKRLQTEPDLEILRRINDLFHGSVEDFYKQEDKERGTISREILKNLQRIEKSSDDKFIGANALAMHAKEDSNETDLLSLSCVAKNHKDYLVCAKSDGMRFLLFVGSNGRIYMNDRKSQFFEVRTDLPPFFLENTKPSEKDKQEPNFKVRYILDGELILNKREAKELENNPNGPINLQYLVFDMLFSNEQSLAFLTYQERLEHAKDFLNSALLYQGFFPKLESELKQPEHFGEPGGRVMIRCILKDFYLAQQTGFLLEHIVEKDLLPHENDGLIFTKINYPYLPGKNRGILKWKPAELNTIDFFVTDNTRYLNDTQMSHLFEGGDFYPMELFVVYGDNLLFFDFIFLNEAQYIEIQAVTKKVHPERDWYGAIMECSYDHEMVNPHMLNFLDVVYAESSTDDLEKIIKQSAYPPKDKANYAKPETSGEEEPDPEEEWRELLRRVAPKDYLLGLYKCFELRGTSETKGGWKAIRGRPDKEFPNNFKTAYETYLTIFEANISRDDLIQKLSLETMEQGQKKQKTN